MIDKRILCGLISIFCLLLFSIPSRAQKPKKTERKAIKAFEKGNLIEARDLFLELYESEYAINTTATYLAQCYLGLYEPSKARMVLSGLSSPNTENVYLLIIANYFSENFGDADRLLQTYQDSVGFDMEAFEQQLNGASSNYENSNGYLIQNFGSQINTPNREYSVVMYDDYNELLFTSRKEQHSVFGQDGLDYEMIYSTSIDSSNNWKQAKRLDIRGSQSRSHDAPVQVYRSGNKMISYHDNNLYSLSLIDGEWSRDENLMVEDFNGTNTHCFISEDEQILFFASDFASGGEHLDLYVMQMQADSSWSDPIALGVFNTEYDEDAPFLAGDGTFYFSSRGHNSMGGYDVFKSRFDSLNNEWNAPENMGHPINTVAEDIYYTTDGKLGYLSSTRVGGYGSLDIYRVFLFNKVKVNGTLLDDKSQPIANADIDITYDSTHLKTYTDQNGDYEIFVPIQKNMHVTFIKDSLNLYEGDYIVNVFFKDQNDNEFNFYIDYENDKPELVGGVEDRETVRHINVQVKNDYSENLMIASIPKNEEKEWSDSLNITEKQQKESWMLKAPEKQTEVQQVVDINSSNLSIHKAVITKKAEETLPPENNEVSKAGNTSIQKTGYTVQILAMYLHIKPDQSFFEKLGPTAKVQNTLGKDKLNRYYTGLYQSFQEALQAMRALRAMGYTDAFVRNLKKYSEL